MVEKSFKPKLPLDLPTETEIKLLSQKEIEYLRSPNSFNTDYSYVLKHKIKSKVKALNDELELLQRAGLIVFSKITENSKNVESQKKLKMSLEREIKAGPMGFEPVTFSLEGCYAL